jgi:hypothetical protein
VIFLCYDVASSWLASHQETSTCYRPGWGRVAPFLDFLYFLFHRAIGLHFHRVVNISEFCTYMLAPGMSGNRCVVLPSIGAAGLLELRDSE